MYFFHLITLSSVLHTVRKGENVLCGFYPKLLGIYLKRPIEEAVLSDKTQKMVDSDLHGSYSIGLRECWYRVLLALNGNTAWRKYNFTWRMQWTCLSHGSHPPQPLPLMEGARWRESVPILLLSGLLSCHSPLCPLVLAVLTTLNALFLLSSCKSPSLFSWYLYVNTMPLGRPSMTIL